LKIGSAWDPADPEMEPGRVEEKTGEGKTWCDLADPARPCQKPGCNPLIFVFFFFTKTTLFFFLRIDPVKTREPIRI